jgi:hypothetical protein
MNTYRHTFKIALMCLLMCMGCVEPTPASTMQVPIQSTKILAPLTQPVPTYSFDLDAGYIEGAQMFDAEKALKHIEYLASDELQGRLVGTPGNKAAGNYIAARFAEYGLQPAGIDGSYFQPFTATVTLNTEQPILTIMHPGSLGRKSTRHTYVAHYEYVPRIAGYIGSGDATGEVVWLGRCNPDDFSTTLAGKIVLCAPLSGPEFGPVVEKALKYKVSGLLIIREDDGPYGRSAYGGFFSSMIDIPAFRVSYSITEDLLADSGYTLDDLDRLAVPTTLVTSVHMSNRFERTETQARNVLAFLPGTDPLLTNEVVIVGAHYDHVGVDPDGTIYNGANDNASGVAVILEIARLWQSQHFHAARSVLFAAWDAEEQGLEGASHYVSNPIYPLDQTVAYINVDCVGVGALMTIYGQNEMVNQLEVSADTFRFTWNSQTDNLADDLPFHNAVIPSAGLMTNPDEYSYYPELHRPEDDVQIIQLDALRMTGILTAHALFAVAGGSGR